MDKLVNVRRTVSCLKMYRQRLHPALSHNVMFSTVNRLCKDWTRLQLQFAVNGNMTASSRSRTMCSQCAMLQKNVRSRNFLTQYLANSQNQKQFYWTTHKVYPIIVIIIIIIIIIIITTTTVLRLSWRWNNNNNNNSATAELALKHWFQSDHQSWVTLRPVSAWMGDQLITPKVPFFVQSLIQIYPE